MEFQPIELMLKRVESSKYDSDTSYFYDLIALGEIVTKITALFLISNIEDDVDRTRYRFEYNLVRADGIGTFAEVINSISRGSAADLLSIAVRDCELPELTNRIKNSDWQKNALVKLNQCLSFLEINANEITDKSSLLIWFSNFATLRNKTKGHGSITPTQCSKINENLYESIVLIYDNLFLFKRPWAYLYQNYSKKYRVTYINSKTSDFNYLKTSTSYTLSNGVYCYTDKPRKVNFIYSDPELSFYALINGNFTGKNQFETYEG